MEDQDQLLKDFVASAQKYGYDYDVVMSKFPEFEGYDVEMLKSYVSKVEELNQGSDDYDYTEANAAFPELFTQKKKDQPEGISPLAQPLETASADATSVSGVQSGDSGWPANRTRVTPQGYSFSEPVFEKPFIEGKLGDFVRAIPIIGNDIDDWARSWSEGAAKRGQIAPAMDILIPTYGELSGEAFDSADYLEAATALSAEVQRYQNHVQEYGISDELDAWNRSIEENGSGLYGLFKTIYNSRGDLRNILGQWALQSLSTQLNEEAVEKAVAVQVGGMTAGAPLGPAGIGAAGVATLPFSMATMSGVTAASQFVVERLQERVGEDFSPEAILDALSDDDFRNELRKDAAKYGLVIGLVDGVTFKASAGISNELGIAYKGTALPKTREALAVATSESVGGGTGEVLAKTAIGEEATAEEVFQEMTGGLFNTPLVMSYSGIQDMQKSGIDNPNSRIINQLNARAEYSVNGQKVDKQTLLDIVGRMTAEEFESMNIEVKDDTNTADIIQRRYEEIKKGETVVPLPTPKEPSPYGRFRDYIVKKFQDNMDPVIQLQRSAEEAREAEVSDKTNMDMAFSLMSSRAAERLKIGIEAAKKIGTTLYEGGVRLAMLNRYLYARHAPERNRVMSQRYKDRIQQIQDEVAAEKRTITPKEQKEIQTLQGYIEENRGSGMSDADAAAFMESLTPEQRSVLEKAAAVHDEIVADTRATIREYGLESDDTVDLFESQYEYYTPLRGFSEIDPDRLLKGDYSGVRGQGIDVRGSGIIGAEGRVTEAADMSVSALHQNANIHLRAEKNKAAQTVYNFVNSNPNPDVYSTVNEEGYNGLTDAEKKRAVGVRIDGKTEYIVFKPKYAEQAALLRDMSPQKMGTLGRWMSSFNRFRSKTFTSLNPEFFTVNFTRDIETAFINLASEYGLSDKQSRSMIANTLKDSPKNLAYMFGSMSPSVRKKLQESDPQFYKLFEEFKQDGGVTGWGYAPSIESLAKELDKLATEGEKSKMSAAWMAKNGMEVLTTMSDAFENSIRFSTYVNARKMGFSRERAAFMAKEVTVNFNRSGEWGPALNATYMFFNASVQGSAKVLKTMNSPSGRKIGMGMALVGAMMTEYNRSVSGEDENGEKYYDKISPYERSRNLIIMRENGKDYVKIPLAYGYGLFYNTGEQVSSVAHGGRTAGEASWEMMDATISAFSPMTFGSSDDMLTKAGKTFMPSTLTPAFEVIVNEDWQGNKIYFDYEGKASSEQAYDSPEAVIDFFQWLNRETGGSEVAGGQEFYSIDINPDKLTHAISGYAGGIGQFATKTAETVGALVEGETPDIGRFPILSKFYSRSNYAEISDYFEYKDDLEIAEIRVEEFNNPEVREQFKDTGRFVGIGTLETELKDAKKTIDDLQDKLEKAHEAGDKAEIARYEGLINKRMLKFIKAFDVYQSKVENYESRKN